jgi:hypothetical protein
MRFQDLIPIIKLSTPNRFPIGSTMNPFEKQKIPSALPIFVMMLFNLRLDVSGHCMAQVGLLLLLK